MKATAAVVRQAGGPFLLEGVDVEDPRPDEVLVRIVASGICHTDVAVRDQTVALPLPMVLGHEGSGVVEAVGSGIEHVRPGDHVVLSGDSCGHCRNCHQGRPSYCDAFVESNLTGLRRDGTSPIHRALPASGETSGETSGDALRGRFVGQSSFATWSLAPGRSVIPVPRDLPLALLGPLGCGLTTGVGTVMNALRPPPGSRLVVFGAGTVGLAAVMGAVLSGCETIIAVDPLASRLDMARALGATHTVDPHQQDPVETVQALTAGGADFSVECSGVPAVVRQAVDCLGRPGLCAQVGATPAGAEVALSMDHIGYGRGIRGVVMGDSAPQTFVPYLAALYRSGRLPYDRFVRFYDFEDINQAVHDSAVTGEVIKPILRMA